ncbi:Uncharacterised protein [Helicobacter cinaedi]|uniref:Uncharacterized protein n=1 Tax=Helicobacter cinaedi TaxID=213 RepID=A0A377JRD6_9HELI|nr:Uncharacterised protein [Helicobacter cinaedi]
MCRNLILNSNISVDITNISFVHIHGGGGWSNVVSPVDVVLYYHSVFYFTVTGLFRIRILTSPRILTFFVAHFFATCTSLLRFGFNTMPLPCVPHIRTKQ